MTAETIARALNGRRCGRGWSARCPAHDDRSPSLSITQRDGRVLVHCHAGCRQEAVIDALRARGLWAERPAPELTPEARRAWAEARRQDREDDEPARAFALAGQCLCLTVLESLAPWDLERQIFTDLLATLRSNAALAEYRAWRQRWPELTAAMVAVGRSLRRRREKLALDVLLEVENGKCTA
jgi:hypothetical protein